MIISKKSFNPFSLALTVAFGLLILVVIGYTLIGNKSFELRSKAAEEEKIMKQWEFNGGRESAWKGKSVTNVAVGNGYLEVMTGASSQPEISSIFNTVQLAGIKKFKINLKVPPLTSSSGCRPSTPSNQGMPLCTPQPTTSPQNYSFDAEIHFMKRNTNDDGYADIAKPLTLTGTADGKFHEYVVQFPDTLRTYNILRLRIVFHKIASYTTMDIDYIRLSNVKTMTTPKPTVVKTPTPTITPKPTPKPPTPTPPAGCSYQPQCQSREETDCPVVLVCPQTSITIAPILAIAKTGTVVQDNLEGTSGYKLVVTTTETYRLEAVQDGGAQGGRNPTTTQSSIMEQIRANVGKTVTVTGSLRVGGKPPPGGMNIPTDPTMSTIFVQSIVVL